MISWIRMQGSVVSLASLLLWSTGSGAGPFDALAPGHWYEIPNSKMSSVDPCPGNGCSYSAWGNQSMVIHAWGGGALDTRRSRMLVWGGGHADYAGNEVYAFDLGSQRWSRLTEPSTTVTTNVCHYPDGKPSSRHTYGSLQYSAATDAFVSMGGSATYGDGNKSCTATDALDLATNQWRKLAAAPALNPVWYSTSAVDASTGKMYSFGNDYDLAVFNPSGNAWEGHYKQLGVGLGASAAVDHHRRLLVVAGLYYGAAGAGVKVWNVDQLNSQPEPVKQATSGDKFIESKDNPGFEYDPVSRKFVAWAGGADVYTLDPSTWKWQKMPAASGNTVVPPAPDSNGTYGRFRYVPAHNVFVLVNSTSQNVFVYRLAAGTGDGTGTTTGGSTGGATGGSTGGTTGGSTGGTTGGSTGGTTGGSTGGTTGGSTGGTTGGSTGGTASSTDANADWQRRSTAAGVVLAVGFDEQAQWLNSLAERTGCDAGYAPGCRSNAWDQQQKASGNGSVRFDIRSKSGSNSAGSLALNFSSDLGTQFGEYDEFWVQWRQRFDSTFLTYPYRAEDGDVTNWKQVIIGEGDRRNTDGSLFQANSCTELEQVMGRHANRIHPLMYTTCGEYLGYYDALPYDDNYTWQNARLRPDGRSSCTHYSGRTYSDQSGCLRYVAGEWMTFMVHIKLGAYGTGFSDFHEKQRTGFTGSTLEYYIGRQGGPLELAHREENLVIPNSSEQAKFGKIWLLPYMTSKDMTEVHPDASTWYDEIIVSRQRIAAPGGSAATTPPAPTPSVTLSASPTTVAAGGSSTLTWSAQNASTCSASGGWSGDRALSGQQVVGPLSASAAYTLTCGGVARTVNVTVEAPPPAGGGGSGSSANQPPAVPVVASPGSSFALDGGEIGTAAPYSDPENDPLASAEWEISADQAFTTPVLRKTVTDRTGLLLAAGLLEPSTRYWVRTRHRDARSATSGWSAPVSFQAAARLSGDADADGVVDSYDVQGFADSNANGVGDAEEGICNLLDAAGGNVVGIQADAGSTQCVRSVAAGDMPQSPPTGASLPYGLFNFRIDGLRVDPREPARVTIRVHLPQRPAGTVKWYKFDPATGRFFELDGNVSFEGTTALVELVDGGIGDFDGVVNGVIVDPSGPVTVPTSGGTGGSGGNSQGSGGGSSVGLLLPCLLAGVSLSKCTTSPTKPPKPACNPSSGRRVVGCPRPPRNSRRAARN